MIWQVLPAYPTASSSQTFTVRAMFQVGGAGSYTYYLGGYVMNGV